jgi:hypothetical protein
VLLSERLGGTSEQSYRALTSILYLNRREWPLERCGGGLRCFVGARADDESGESAAAVEALALSRGSTVTSRCEDAHSLRDAPSRQVETLAPRGGRLVVFPSREVLHEVRGAVGREGGGKACEARRRWAGGRVLTRGSREGGA